MRKIRINKDLFTMIDYAKTGFSLREIGVSTSKLVLPPVAFGVGLMSVFEGSSASLNDYLDFLSYGGLFYLSYFGLDTLIACILRDYNREKANLELLDLATKLSSLDINTTSEMLMGAKLIKKQYSIRSDDKKLALVENKHIEIKVHNGVGKEFEEMLLQEHAVGSKSYEISVEEPKKELQHKLVRHTI